MAHNTAQYFESVFITYKDVKEANPTWTDRMVEDYLALKRDLTLVSDETDSKNDIIKNTTVVSTSPYEITADDEEVFFDTDTFGADMIANLLPGVDGTNYRLINIGITGGFRVYINPFGTEKLFGVNGSEYIAMQEKLIVTFNEALGGWF